MISLSSRKIGSLALIPLFLAIILLLAPLNLTTVFEPPYLLPVLNFLFVGLIPLAVSFFAFRTFRATGAMSMLLVGAGMFEFGLGSIAAGLIIFLPDAPNNNVTIYNTCACIGSIFFLIWSLANLSGPEYRKKEGSIVPIALLSVGLFMFVIAFSLATVMGLVPQFFVQGVGPTVIRQVVLSTTVQCF